MQNYTVLLTFHNCLSPCLMQHLNLNHILSCCYANMPPIFKKIRSIIFILLPCFCRGDFYLLNDCCVASQNLQGLTGTALVAGSPIRHDSTVQGNPVEVQTYQPPWKSLSDFALQSDLEQPAFQQLVGHCELTAGSLHLVREAPVTGTIIIIIIIVRF